MKKLLTLIIVAGLALTIQAQDITNTLSATGNFKVNKNDGTTNLFTLSETGEHTIQFSSTSTGLTINNSTGTAVFAFDESHNIPALTMLTLGHADANWLSGNYSHLQLQSENSTINNKFSMVARGAINYFNAYAAGGTGASPTNSLDNHIIFNINAYGFLNSINRLAAGISFVVDGTPAGIFVPGKIEFHTGTSSASSTIRMTIKSSGAVNFAGAVEKPITVKTADYTADDGDYTIIFNHTNGENPILSLPTAVGRTGRILVIRTMNENNGDRVTIDPDGSETIDGNATVELGNGGWFSTTTHAVTIQSDGSNWWIIAATIE